MRKIIIFALVIIVIFIPSCKLKEENLESYAQKESVIHYHEVPYFDDPIEYCYHFAYDSEWVSVFQKGSKEITEKKPEYKIIYKDYREGIEILQFTSYNSIVKIPEKIDGKFVIKLSGNFYQFDTIEDPPYSFIPCLDNCHYVKKVVIPSKVKEIVYDSFNLNFIEEIEVSKDNPYYSSKNGILYNKDGTIKLCVPNCHPENN